MSALTLPDQDGGTPLYQQVKDAVIAQILAGDWCEGERMPSENRLADTLGLSRMTINRALRELTAEGWLNRVQGAGTFIAVAKPQSAVLEIRSIAEEIRSRGHSHSAKVYILSREPALALQAGLLGLKRGTPLFHTVILHMEDETPLQIEDRYVNPAAAPDYLSQDFNRITPYDYLMQAAPLTRAEHVILAAKPSRREAALLRMEMSDPCLLLRRRTWSGETAVSWVRLLHPGDRYRLGGETRGPGSGFNTA